MTDTRKAVLQLEIDFARSESQRAARSLRSLADSTRELDRVGDQGARALRAGAAAADDAARAYDRAADSARRLQASQDQFDRVSRDVGLAGDVQSNLGAISGLAGATGLPGAGGVAVGGELVALIEELPRLKTAAQGLPATIEASAKALGTSSAGLIGAVGALGLAAAAVTVAVKQAVKEIQKASGALSQSIDAQLEAERLINSGGTVEQARARIASLEAEAQSLRTVEQRTRAGIDGLSGFERALARLAGILPGVTSPFEQAKELAVEAEAAERGVAALQDAIEQGRLSNETAATAANNAASVETQLRARRDEVAAASRAAADAESRLTSERARERARGQGTFIPERNVTVYGSAGARQTATRAPSTAASGPSPADIANQIADEERSAATRRLEAAREYNREVARAERERERRLADIQRQAARDERDAARGRDFAQILSIRERAQDAKQETLRAAQRENDERRLALNERLDDIGRAAQMEINMLRSKLDTEQQLLSTGYNRSLALTRNFAEGLVNVGAQLNGARDGMQQAVRDELNAILGGAS